MRKFAFPPRVFAFFLFIGMVLSFVVLYLGSGTSTLIETLSLLISMLLLFFLSHPLSHYIVSRLYRVDVKYFFLSKSDFRKIGGAVGRIVGGLIPAIGTKLDLSQVSRLSRGKRAFLFGSGAIVSNILVALLLFLALFYLHFTLIALVIGSLFLVASVLTEIVFGTRVGDLQKMRREYSR